MEDLGPAQTQPKGPGLQELAKQPFLDHAPEISGALVYLDAGAAEVASTSLGAPFLLGLGAVNVCDLEGAVSRDSLPALLSGQTVTTLIIVTTKMLMETHSHVLKAILEHPTVTKVLILSSVSEHAHACYGDAELGVEAYTEYASYLQSDVEDGRSGRGVPPTPVSISVKHLPLHMCVVDEHAFVLPARCAAATQARSGGVAAGLQGAEQPARSDDVTQVSDGLTLLAHTLVSLAAQIGGKLETHALGPVSTLLAREVASLPQPSHTDHPPPTHHPGQRPPTLGLVLVDRSLDLVTPSSHPDTILDLVLASLPRGHIQQPLSATAKKRTGQVEWRSTDVRVECTGLQPLHPLSYLPPDLAPKGVWGAELFQPWDKGVASKLSQLLKAKTRKDGAVLARKWLKQALSSEKLQPSQRFRAGQVTKEEITSLMGDLKGAALRQESAQVIGQCTAMALESDTGARWDSTASLEKQLVAMLVQMGYAEGGSYVCAALRDALARSQQEEAPLLPSDILTLLPAVYSVLWDVVDDSPRPPVSPFAPEDLANLRADLVKALQSQVDAALASESSDNTEAASPSGRVMAQALSEVLPTWRQLQPQQLQTTVDTFLKRLEYIAQARRGLTELKRVTVSDMFAENVGSVVPLLKTLTRKIIQGHDMEDLKTVTSDSMGGLLAKGLSKVGGLAGGLAGGLLNAVAAGVSSKGPTPLHEVTTLLIFVVGGVSLAEIREVRVETEHNPNMQVYVAGTSLLSPCDVVAQLMA